MGNLSVDPVSEYQEVNYGENKKKLKERTNNSVLADANSGQKNNNVNNSNKTIKLVNKGRLIPAEDNSTKTITIANKGRLIPYEESPLNEVVDVERYELSWGEIGDVALKSSGNFVKSMFCDENGFSLKRTAMTVGTVAALAFAAPIAAGLGASAAVVGVVAGTAKLAGLGIAGVMAYNGGKNIVEGTQKYYESTTEQEAKANMEQAMDGAVEVTAALPAFLFIKGGANKGKKMASKKAETKPAAEPKPAETPAETPAAEPKPTETKPTGPKPASGAVNYNEVVGNAEVFNTAQGAKFVKYKNISGNILKEVVSDKDGNLLYTREFSYASDGSEVGFTIKWAEGIEDVFVKGSNIGRRTKPDGSIWSVKFENNSITEISQIKPAEVKPTEPKPTEPKPAENKPSATERKIPETKNLSDEKNLKELIAKLLNKDSKNADLVKRFMEDLKDYNDPAFTEASIRQILTESADLLNCGLKVYVENGKILLTLDDGVTYAVKLKTAVKPATAPKAEETKPAAEQKVEAPKSGEAKPAAEQKVEAPKADESKPANSTKTEASKAEETKSEPVKTESQPAVDYNKSVRSELKKNSDGWTNEYFYNEKGDIIKLIELDDTGKIKYKSIYEYNSSGENVKDIWQTSDGTISETFYNKKIEIKKVWKWNDGRVDEFYPKGNNIYEGVRTYPDGKKVKIREENNITKELGPVE